MIGTYVLSRSARNWFARVWWCAYFEGALADAPASTRFAVNIAAAAIRCGCCYANNKFEHGILHPASENVAVWTWATPYSTRLSPPCRPDTMLIPVEKERNHQSLI